MQKHCWNQHIFWSDDYFACSIGEVSSITIQKYIESQGSKGENDTFAVHAYDWSEDFDTERKPNFVWRNVRIYWYKHFRRESEVYYSGDDITMDTLADMINECLASLQDSDM